MAGRRKAGPGVRVLCGPPRSQRHGRVLEYLREHWGRALLIVPSTRLATARLEDLLLSGEVAGAWGRPVETFQSFVTGLLEEHEVDVRLLDEIERRAILEHVVEQVSLREGLGPVADAAATLGFVNHMMRVITQLKQAAVEPSEFRSRIMAHGRAHWLDGVVAEIYEGYQAELIARGRYDLVGLYWRAELVCRAGKPAALGHVRQVVLDGFDDFTPSEFRLLQTVAPHLDSLVFSMNCTLANPSQDDLYATPRATIARIQAAFDAHLLEHEDAAPSRLTHHVSTHLFYRDPPSPAPVNLVEDIGLAVYANPAQEIEGIARAAKRLILDDGVAPSDVLVLFRNLGDHTDLLRAVFRSFGVPATIESRPSLIQSGPGRFVLALLDIVPAWRRDAVLDVITSRWFTPETATGPSVRSLFPTIARVAQVIGGREDWSSKLERLITRLAHDSGRQMAALRSHHPDVDEAAHAMRDAWNLLEEAVQGVAAVSNESDLARVVRGGLNRLGSEHAINTPEDRAAWNALLDVLERIETWSQGAAGRRCADRAGGVRHALAMTSYAVEQPRDGVQVLSFESARQLPHAHVFVAGLVSGAVPQPPAASAIYTDADIADLEAAGIGLESKKGRSARERLLFHHTLSLPRERLYLSWHARSREDKEVGPSPFVADVRELMGPENYVRDYRTRIGSDLHDAMNLRDLRNAAAASDVAVHGFDALLMPVRAAAAIEGRRYQAVPFDAHDGVIADEVLVSALRQRFGADHHFSARQLETYARCPFRFFAQEILGLEEPEDPAPELDPRLRGTIMHDALQRFHTQFRDRAVAVIDPKEADDAMRAAVAGAFEAWSSRDLVTPPAVRAAEVARMTQHLLRYLELERAQDGTWRPAHFEVSFGNVPRDGHDSWSRPEPIPLNTGAGAIFVSGKIDRVDESDDGLRVIDYKTSLSQHTAGAINDGVDLQLLLYVHALEQVADPALPCLSACYLWVGRDKKLQALGKTAGERQAIMVQKIAQYVEGIRGGLFSPSPYPDSCAYCAMRRICRFEEGRIARKTSV